MAHTRNGKAAKLRRQEAAAARVVYTDNFFKDFDKRPPEERLLMMIFGTHDPCMECGYAKLRNEDCQSPHCKSLRAEESKFYDEITDDYIQIRGSRMYAGIDY